MNVFTIIPITIENSTNPSLYSFLSGLKNVFINRGSERREARYLLKLIKNVTKTFVTSIYQKEIRYRGYNKKTIALLSISVGEMRVVNQANC